MKRERGNTRKGATRRTIAKVAKKKTKEAAAKANEVAEKVLAERKVAEEMAEWGSLWSWVVDEEMSWAAATTWIPFWEMDATGDAYDALYGDVLWDYDIWDLKSAVDAPNP